MKVCMWGLHRQRGDISGAGTVMKGCWTMTRPSQLLSETPLLLFPLSQSTSLSRWHFGKSHCHTTFNKDKILSWRGLVRQTMELVCRVSLTQPLSLMSCVFSTGRGRHCGCKTLPRHTNKCVHLCEPLARVPISTQTHQLHWSLSVSFARSLPPQARYVYMFNISPVCQTPASLVLSAEPGWNKRGGERGLRFLNQRKLVLITLPLNKHSDPVNPHAGCQL